VHLYSAGIEFELHLDYWLSCLRFFITRPRRMPGNYLHTFYSLRDGIALGIHYTAAIVDLLCLPISVLVIADSPTRTLWQ
jgi:hypothetical protein